MRKSHSKSRLGCDECKKRHKKVHFQLLSQPSAIQHGSLRDSQCDEGRPRCGHCQRLNTPCSFGQPRSTVVNPVSGSDDSPSSASSSLPTPLTTLGSGPDTHLDIPDLELLHHFHTSVLDTLATDEPRRTIIGDGFVRLGFRHPFLLHKILTLSALHMFSVNTCRIELISLAAAHQSAALRLAQPVIANLTQDDCFAAFGFSGFTGHCALAEIFTWPYVKPSLPYSPRATPVPTNPSRPQTYGRDPLEELMAYFQLSRGIRAVTAPFYPYIMSSYYGGLIKYPEPIVPAAEETLSTHYPHYAELHVLIDTHLAQSSRLNNPPSVASEAVDLAKKRDACHKSLGEIFRYIHIMQNAISEGEKNMTNRLIQTWPVEADALILDMIQKREPISLVILANYAVLMSLREDGWWLKGWPEVLLTEIENVLGKEWERWIEWPVSQIFGSQNQTDNSDVGMTDDTSQSVESSAEPADFLADIHARNESLPGPSFLPAQPITSAYV